MLGWCVRFGKVRMGVPSSEMGDVDRWRSVRGAVRSGKVKNVMCVSHSD
jgi:hypothetical protein